MLTGAATIAPATLANTMIFREAPAATRAAEATTAAMTNGADESAVAKKFAASAESVAAFCDKGKVDTATHTSATDRMNPHVDLDVDQRIAKVADTAAATVQSRDNRK
jgi:hypothetical protein